MMSRLRASLSPLVASLAGQRGVVTFQTKLPLIGRFSFQVESSRRSLHESANEDDDFWELGPPVGGKAVMPGPRKLKTEKADFIWRTRNAQKISAAAISTVKVDHKGKVSSKSGKYALNGFVKEETSVNENIFGVSKMRGLNKVDGTDVKYEQNTSETAFAAREEAVEDPPGRGPSETITIGIGNISAETPDYALHAICSSCGPLSRVTRTGENTADAIFSTKDEANISRILERLSNTILEDCNWSAALVTSDAAPAKINDEDKSNSGLEIAGRVKSLQREFTMREVYCEDFLNLHRAIMRLEKLKNDSTIAN